MKKILAILLVLIAGTLIYGASTTYNSRERYISTPYSELKSVVVSDTDGDANDFTVTLSNLLHVTLERIIVDTNGTDTSFKLYIYDTATTYNDVALFSKTDFTTASEPYQYALVQSDVDSQEYLGIPVVGPVSITLADGDDSELTGIEVYLLYREQWQP